MSMEEWPDDHLDELFRKSAEEFDIPFNADDWTDMSRRLDEHDRHSMFDRISRWGGITALVLLLLGGLGWVMYDEKPTGNHQQAVITVLTPARKSVIQSAGTSQPEKAAALTHKSQSASPTSRNVPDNQLAGVDNTVRKEQNAVSITSPSGQVTTKEADNQLAILADRGKVPLANELSAAVPAALPANRGKVRKGLKRVAQPAGGQMANVGIVPSSNETGGANPASARVSRQLTAKQPRRKTENTAVVERAIAVNRADQRGTNVPVLAAGLHQNPDGNVPGAVSESQPDRVVKAPGADQITTDSGTDSRWLPALTTATSLSNVVRQVEVMPEPLLPDVTVTAPASRAMPKLTGLSVLLFASPDLSGIGLTNFDRPGTNAGLSIQYQITDRLSINAGAMYSTKHYQSYSSEYVWPSYMNMDVWPAEISGVCKMIDVPLNVRYDWLLRRRGDGRAPARWFASAGLTSYFIQHEVYSYEYENPADPKIKSWGWDNKKAGRAGGSFGFSNLNVSLGYERPITNRLSWQVEPFLKVPLKQVGYFKIRLLSTGAFVGLRYRF